MEVLNPGMLTTMQDLGRPGYSHLGVSGAGAADPLSARVANRLVGNSEDAVVMECTLRGGSFEFSEERWISLCGGQFEANVALWEATRVPAGFVLRIGGSSSGARCYVAVRGGFQAARILGSSSVHLLSGFGAPVRKGQVISFEDRVQHEVMKGVSVVPPVMSGVLHVTPGPDMGEFSSADVFSLLSAEWTASEQSNRQGVRLRGEPLEIAKCGGSRASEGVALGAVQVPASGEPLILFVDSQTTGGYPVIANVICADLPAVGQLRPRDRVRFVAISFEEARELLLAQEAWIRNVG